MNKDRIKIDGEWYVKESIADEPSVDIFKPTCYTTRLYETDGYTFKAAQLLKQDGTIWENSLSLEIKYKSSGSKKYREFIDNPNWLLGVHEGEDEALREVDDRMTEQGLAELKAVIKDLIKVDWLK